MKNSKKNIISYVLAFSLPIIIFVFSAIIIGIYPFGNMSVLCNDADSQFAAFYSYFRTVITGPNDFFYTFSKNLGGDFLSFCTYYLQNPFLLILVPFSTKNIPLGMFIMYTVQIGLMGLTASIFFKENPGKLIFSTSYALMGMVFAYFSLSIYFCSFILLPLIMLGIKKIINNFRDFYLYVVTLTLAIFCNYYLSYMICIFSALFFIYEITLANNYKIKENIKSILESFISFAVASIVSVIINLITIIPTIKALSGYKDAPSSLKMSINKCYPLKGLIRQFLPGAFRGNLGNDSLPYIYVGIIPVIFIAIYLFNKKVSIKGKISSIIFLSFMLICTYINVLDVVWHGFNEPEGFAHRFAFLISFLILYIGSKGYVDEPFNKKPVFIGLLAICCLDLCLNTVISLKSSGLTEYSEFSGYVERVEPLIDEIKNRDNSLYRLEKDFDYSMNDAMLLNYKGLSHYSSCEDDSVRKYIAKMGLRAHERYAFYNQGATVFTDCFLGVKYFISRFDTNIKGYADFSVNDDEDAYAFKNDMALPLAFVVNTDAKDVELSDKYLFDNQNKLIKCFDYSEDIYTPAKFTMNPVNLSVDGDTYTKIDENEDAYLEYEITMSGDNNLYLYLTAPEIQGARILINDFDSDNYFSDIRWNIKPLGAFKTGEDVNIRVLLTGDSLIVNDSFFYEENLNDIAKWHDTAMSLGTVNLVEIKSSHLTGDASIKKEGYIAFSIPYDDSWKCIVDGQIIKPERILDGLLGIPISKGNHRFEIKYSPW